MPIIGPGARPYRRSTAFARFAEVVGAYLAIEDVQIAVRVQRAFFFMLIELVGYVPEEASGIRGKHILVCLLQGLEKLRRSQPLAIPWLREASRLVARTLNEAIVLNSEQANLVVETGDAMVEQILRNRDTVASSLTVTDLGLFARRSDSLRLLTIHGAKGREFDAVALIDLHDGRVPYYLATTTTEELAAERRKLYVACTRARKILMLFTDSSNWKNRPSRFLTELGLTSR